MSSDSSSKINHSWTRLSWTHLVVTSHNDGCLCYKLTQSCHWSVQKKCGTCFMCSIVCLLPFLHTPSILKAKIEERDYNSRFARGHGWTRVPKNVLMGCCSMISATQGRNDASAMTKEQEVRRRRGRKKNGEKKGSQNCDSCVRGEGVRGSRGGGGGAPPCQNEK